MAYKDLCQIKTLAFRVAFTGSVPENLSFSQNLKAVSIAPSRFLVLHSGPFFMAYRSLCRMKVLLCAWGSISMFLFCTADFTACST